MPFFTDLIAFRPAVRGAVQGEPDAFFTLLARRTRLSRVVTASVLEGA
ncbi:MAG: hypothetical protein IPP03_22705 [Dechloromonas sp.]|nr:hypothetical protein [Candidatus Dechloromonas phosphoritropha]